MSGSPGFLHSVAIQLGQLGTIFYDLWKSVKEVVWIGPFVARFFYWAYERCYWAAHYTYLFDRRIEALPIDELVHHPVAWVLKRLGAHPFWAYFYEGNPWGWLFLKIQLKFPFLQRLYTDPGWWFREELIRRFPELWSLFHTPNLWLTDRLGNVWLEFREIRYHPVPWILKKLGASPMVAYFYEYDPWGWVKMRIGLEWPFLSALLYHPREWVWSLWTEGVDRFIDTRIEWLISTAGRVLNLIWQQK